MSSPSYSPTDIGTAVATVVVVALDVLAGYGVLPTLDPQTRTALMTSLTVLAVFGVGAYVANRRVKHQAQAAVAVAQAAVPLGPSVPVAVSAPMTSTNVGPFMLVPVTPSGPSGPGEPGAKA